MTRRTLGPSRRACAFVLGMVIAALVCAGGMVVLATIIGTDKLLGTSPTEQ